MIPISAGPFGGRRAGGVRHPSQLSAKDQKSLGPDQLGRAGRETIHLSPVRTVKGLPEPARMRNSGISFDVHASPLPDTTPKSTYSPLPSTFSYAKLEKREKLTQTFSVHQRFAVPRCGETTPSHVTVGALLRRELQGPMPISRLRMIVAEMVGLPGRSFCHQTGLESINPERPKCHQFGSDFSFGANVSVPKRDR